MAWKTCQKCGGTGGVMQGSKRVTCPACGGAGGIDTKNV